AAVAATGGHQPCLNTTASLGRSCRCWQRCLRQFCEPGSCCIMRCMSGLPHLSCIDEQQLPAQVVQMLRQMGQQIEQQAREIERRNDEIERKDREIEHKSREIAWRDAR